MNQSNINPKPTKKANLKFVKGNQSVAPRLRLGGISPSDAMQPGEYKVICEAGRLTSKFGKPVIELAFRVAEGDHFGTYLPGWLPIHIVGGVVRPCRYIEQCAAVLGREIEPDDDIDPESVFVGKLLLVDVKFRLTNGKTRSPEDQTRKKDEKDFLKVWSVLGVAEL
jgi:hypothetical protein